MINDANMAPCLNKWMAGRYNSNVKYYRYFRKVSMWSWCSCIIKYVPLSIYASHDTETLSDLNSSSWFLCCKDTLIHKTIGDKNPMLYTFSDKNSRLPIRINKTNRSLTLMVSKQILQMYQMLGRNSFIFIQENAFENVVCERASIYSRPQWVERQFLP